MASPVKKRTALVGKNVNIRQPTGAIKKTSNSLSSHGSPKKKSQADLSYALKHSPVRSVSVSPKKNSTTFTFHEETPTERTATLMMHMSLTKKALFHNDENDFSGVKENMSPSKSSRLKQRSPVKRQPLRDLSIEEYKGFIQTPFSKETTPLTLHYSKKIPLPNFVTPPRDKKLREFFTLSKNSNPPIATSRSTDDIPKDKIVRKLNFKIHEN